MGQSSESIPSDLSIPNHQIVVDLPNQLFQEPQEKEDRKDMVSKELKESLAIIDLEDCLDKLSRIDWIYSRLCTYSVVVPLKKLGDIFTDGIRLSKDKGITETRTDVMKLLRDNGLNQWAVTSIEKGAKWWVQLVNRTMDGEFFMNM